MFDPYTPTLTRHSGSVGEAARGVPTVQGRHMAKARQAANSARWKEQRGVGAWSHLMGAVSSLVP